MNIFAEGVRGNAALYDHRYLQQRERAASVMLTALTFSFCLCVHQQHKR